MTIHSAVLSVQSEARVTFHDITAEVANQLAMSRIDRGIAVVSTPHTTCSILIQEESHDATYLGVEFLMQDLLEILGRLAPDCVAEGQYHHPGPAHIAGAVRERSEEPWWSLNVDGHLRSVLLGRSESVPINNGALGLGEFGRLYFADFDRMRARERQVQVTLMGESATA
jgi:secondary thiamine-phosphate synthase enzyme